MEPFRWEPYFATDLPEIDAQHHRLVDLVNELGTSFAEDHIERGGILRLFEQLSSYARVHFQDEEKLMARFNVDQRHQDQHIEVHKSFLGEVQRAYSQIKFEDHHSIKSLLNFLTQWLIYHILGVDQSMANQVKLIKRGLSPEDAYLEGERVHDSATSALLSALDQLFEQVSARNKELLLLNQSLEEKVAQRTQALREANHHLEVISLTDALTGLPNRRHAMRCLAELWERSTLEGSPLTCMMIDADYFKEVNDTHGHDAGDEVLRALSRALKHAMRTDDVVARLGGDEFFILCPKTDLRGGLHAAEAIHRAISALRVPTGDGEWRGSVSVGVAARRPEHGGYEALIKAADQGVYAAKGAGRGCVRTIDAPA